MLWPPKLRDLAGIVIFGIVVGVIAWRCWTLLRPADDPHSASHTALCDFQDVVYYPARAAAAGVSPYDARPPEAGGIYLSRFGAGNSFPVYAPLIFFCSSPFAILPLLPSEVLYWLTNVALLVLYAYVLLRMAALPCEIGPVALLAACLLFSRPGHANFYFGAITLPMTLATLAAWQLADRRPWLSAVCLAIATIKPTFGGPLFVLMLVRGNYRAAFSGLAMAVAANALVMGMLLPHELTSGKLLTQLIANQAATDNDPAVDPQLSASRIDALMVAERLSGLRFFSSARLALALAFLAIAGWNLRLLARRNGQTSSLLSAGLMCLTIALCIYHNIYDALLVAPTAMLALRVLMPSRPFGRSWLGWPLAICVGVVALNYLSSKQFWTLVERATPALWEASPSGSLWTLVCTLNGICLMIAWCLLLVMIRRHIAAAPAAMPQ